jgi:hypothetical protein
LFCSACFVCNVRRLDFVGFVVNLLNGPTDGATVNAGFVGFIVNVLTLKNASEKELLLVRMGVRKITFFIKGA